MHETKGDTRAGLVAARPRSARDDKYPIDLALIAVTFPSLVMAPPELLAGIRPVVCLLPDLDGPECFVIVVSSGSGAPTPSWNQTLIAFPFDFGVSIG
jgi:hypothetical protein